MVGHSDSVNIQFHDPLDEDEARDLLLESHGLIVIDKREPTLLHHAQGSPGRVPGLRQPYPQRPDGRGSGLNLWVVADNLRKGAALNGVQIAELLSRARPDQAEGPRCSNMSSSGSLAATPRPGAGGGPHGSYRHPGASSLALPGSHDHLALPGRGRS